MTYKPFTKPTPAKGVGGGGEKTAIHPSWLVFIRYCREMGHGEIANLKIQDGIPVLAEETRHKVKFV